MQAPKPLSRGQVFHAARNAIRILRKHGYEVCLFGSVACALWGMDYRDPKDVDIIVVNPDKHVEDIKAIVAAESTAFCLEPSVDRRKRYKKLIFQPGGTSPWKCKVDILLPGTKGMSIPQGLSSDDIVYLEGKPDLPVLPLLPVILLKLRGWCANKKDIRSWKRKKSWKDAKDLDVMLDIAINNDVDLNTELQGRTWAGLKRHSPGRVEKFVDVFPDSANKWERLGLSAGR